MEFDNAKRTVSRLSVAFEPPQPITVSLGDRGALEISFGWRLSGRKAVTTRSEIEQTGSFIVTFPSDAPFSEAIKLAGRLRNFLNLAVGHPVHPTRVVGHVPSTNDDEETLRVEVIYSLSDRPSDRDLERDVHPGMMLFTLAEVRDSLEQRLQTWMSRYDLLEPTFDLYFGAVYNQAAYAQQTFLSLAQALETYHRRTSPRSDLPEGDHKAWLQRVVAAASDTDRVRLVEKLRFSNEVSLRGRLREILNSCPAVVGRLIDDPKRFISAIVDARNYLTHYAPELEQRAPRGIELLPLTVQLRALVEMSLLGEIGFNCTEIDAMFERVDRYREAANLVEQVRARRQDLDGSEHSGARNDEGRP